MTLKTLLLSPKFVLFGIGLIGIGIGYLLRRFIAEQDIRASEVRVRTIMQTAQTQAGNIRRDAEHTAKETLHKARQEFHQESQLRRQEMATLEQRLAQRENSLDAKFDLIEQKEHKLSETTQQLKAQEDALVKKQEELNALIQEERTRLQKLSGLSPDEAKKLFLERLNTELTHEAAGLIRQKYEEVQTEVDRRARELVTQAIQKCAVDAVTETTVSVITLPSEEMKGRIIGREGRNIRSLEMATGVDVIIDETPETVTLSGFDPIKREVARIALERLIEDGRIHPPRIEEVVAKVKQEMETTVRDIGEQATAELGIHNLHPELVKLVGKLKYRTSYGQNVLQHAKEVAYLAGYIAAELKLDVNTARRSGLLHDIAKAVSQEIEGPQAEVGMQLLRKYGEKEEVIHAVEAHHQDVEAHSLYAVLVQAADAISAARPGARRESLDNYVKRLEKLEQIAKGFKGVNEAYAIQAGREVRVMVKPDQVDDAQTVALARDITKKIQTTTDFPGQIKVTVIRELRAVEYAR